MKHKSFLIGVIITISVFWGLINYTASLWQQEMEGISDHWLEIEDLGADVQSNVVIESPSIIYEVEWNAFLDKVVELNASNVFYVVDITGEGMGTSPHPRFYVLDSTLQMAWRTEAR